VVSSVANSPCKLRSQRQSEHFFPSKINQPVYWLPILVCINVEKYSLDSIENEAGAGAVSLLWGMKMGDGGASDAPQPERARQAQLRIQGYAFTRMQVSYIADNEKRIIYEMQLHSFE
jgi:hypothetical protein